MQHTDILKANSGTVLDVLGPIVEFLNFSEDSPYCVMKGTIPPGVSVPLHSHADDEESFYVLSGEGEVLEETEEGFVWKKVRRGDFVDISAGTKHAWRNQSDQPFDALIIATTRLGMSFLELGRPFRGNHSCPTLEDMERFFQVSQRYSYWLGSPEENKTVGITWLAK